MIKRRHLLKHGSLTVASAALASCQPKQTQKTATPSASATETPPKVRWQMVSSFPKTLRIQTETVETICRKVSTITKGNFSIVPHVAGELVKPLEIFDGVKDNIAECGYTVSDYALQKSPALTFATTLPFGFNFQQRQAWLSTGGGLKLLRKLHAQFGLINFPAGSTGVQMGGWYKQEINSIEDLKGLKMRIPGMGGKILQRLGAETKILPPGDIFRALETGELDAAEFVGPFDDESLGLNRIAPYYYSPGWWEPSNTIEVVVNLNAWNRLPPTYQEIFKSAVAAAHALMISRYEAESSAALERLALQNTQFRKFSPKILNTARQVTFDMYDELAEQDALFKEIYLSWKNFREQIYPWSQLGEISFGNFTFKR